MTLIFKGHHNKIVCVYLYIYIFFFVMPFPIRKRQTRNNAICLLQVEVSSTTVSSPPCTANCRMRGYNRGADLCQTFVDTT